MMNDIEINEIYQFLEVFCKSDELKLEVVYKEMRNLLERICRSAMTHEHLQMTDLSARISWLSARFELSVSEQNRLHTFRLDRTSVV